MSGMVVRRLQVALAIAVFAVCLAPAGVRAETQPCCNAFPYLYRHAFDREISAEENVYWSRQAEQSGFTAVMHVIAKSREGYHTLVEYGYRRLLGRMPDAPGASHYTDALRASGDVVGFVVALASSSEIRRGKTHQDYVEVLYTRLLDRAPDAGANYWVERLARGSRPSAVARAIATSNEADALRARTLFRLLLEREPDADGAAYWHARMNGLPQPAERGGRRHGF